MHNRGTHGGGASASSSSSSPRYNRDRNKRSRRDLNGGVDASNENGGKSESRTRSIIVSLIFAATTLYMIAYGGDSWTDRKNSVTIDVDPGSNTIVTVAIANEAEDANIDGAPRARTSPPTTVVEGEQRGGTYEDSAAADGSSITTTNLRSSPDIDDKSWSEKVKEPGVSDIDEQEPSLSPDEAFTDDVSKELLEDLDEMVDLVQHTIEELPLNSTTSTPAPHSTHSDNQLVSANSEDAPAKSLLPTKQLRKFPKSSSARYYTFVGNEMNFAPYKSWLKSHKWKRGKLVRNAYFHIVNDVEGYAKSVKNNPNAMVNSLGLKTCLWGSKSRQLGCRIDYAASKGCSYTDLAIQPPQFRMFYPEECRAFFKELENPMMAHKLWVRKSDDNLVGHSAGSKIYSASDAPMLIKHYKNCSEGDLDHVEHDIMMLYMSDSALIAASTYSPFSLPDHKFDVRIFCLVASADPFVVFYHDGFARRAMGPYTMDPENNWKTKGTSMAHFTNIGRQDLSSASKADGERHFMEFAELSTGLLRSGFPENYLRDKFRPLAEKATLFAIHAYMKTYKDTRAEAMEKKGGQWQLFGIDFIIDSSGGVHLLEGNGFPRVSNYHGELPKTFPHTWEGALDLVYAVQGEPEKLMNKPGSHGSRFEAGVYSYKGWDLIYNELEGKDYDPCDPKVFGPQVWPNAVHKYHSTQKDARKRVTLPKPLDCSIGAPDAASGKPLVAFGSSMTCMEMGWGDAVKGKVNVQGYTCSSSKVPDYAAEQIFDGMLPAPLCSSFVSWQEAKDFCENGGARLCTFEELKSRIAQDSGCGYDDRRTWTATKCAPDHHMTLGGVFSPRQPIPPRCTPDVNEDSHVPQMKKIVARCCGDEGGQKCVSEDDPSLSMKLTVLNGGPVEYCPGDEELRGSVLTCSELRFERATTSVVNAFNEEVCYYMKKANSACPKPLRFADAENVCLVKGARMCSAKELKFIYTFDEMQCATNQGERGESELTAAQKHVWTSTPCDLDDGSGDKGMLRFTTVYNSASFAGSNIAADADKTSVSANPFEAAFSNSFGSDSSASAVEQKLECARVDEASAMPHCCGDWQGRDCYAENLGGEESERDGGIGNLLTNAAGSDAFGSDDV